MCLCSVLSYKYSYGHFIGKRNTFLIHYTTESNRTKPNRATKSNCAGTAVRGGPSAVPFGLVGIYTTTNFKSNGTTLNHAGTVRLRGTCEVIHVQQHFTLLLLLLLLCVPINFSEHGVTQHQYGSLWSSVLSNGTTPVY